MSCINLIDEARDAIYEGKAELRADFTEWVAVDLGYGWEVFESASRETLPRGVEKALRLAYEDRCKRDKEWRDLQRRMFVRNEREIHQLHRGYRDRLQRLLDRIDENLKGRK